MSLILPSMHFFTANTGSGTTARTEFNFSFTAKSWGDFFGSVYRKLHSASEELALYPKIKRIKPQVFSLLALTPLLKTYPEANPPFLHLLLLHYFYPQPAQLFLSQYPFCGDWAHTIFTNVSLVITVYFIQKLNSMLWILMELLKLQIS